LFSFSFWYIAVTSISLPIAILFAILAGEGFALIAFMPVHEASHASTTDSPTMWRLLGALMDFVLGASFFSWVHQHFLGHHPYTNISNGDEVKDAIDPDIMTGDPDIRRIKSNQIYRKHYRFQMFYAPILYGLLAVKFRINDFLIWYVLKTNGKISMSPANKWHTTTFWAGKTFFLVYRILIPIYMVGFARGMLIWAISDLVTGFSLALSFQVNHVVSEAEFPIMDKKTGFVNMDWAEMQVRTTIDYAHNSWLTTFLVGGLNFQVVHHLFPNICQTFYPEIAPIVVEHCKQYGIKYTVLPTFYDAFKAHLKYLSIMGHAHMDI